MTGVQTVLFRSKLSSMVVGVCSRHESQASARGDIRSSRDAMVWGWGAALPVWAGCVAVDPASGDDPEPEQPERMVVAIMAPAIAAIRKVHRLGTTSLRSLRPSAPSCRW